MDYLDESKYYKYSTGLKMINEKWSQLFGFSVRKLMMRQQIIVI